MRNTGRDACVSYFIKLVKGKLLYKTGEMLQSLLLQYRHVQ